MSRTIEQDNEFHGVGGSFTVGKDGKRTRVEETKDHTEGNRPRDDKGVAIVDKPIAKEDLEGHLAGLPAPAARKPWQPEGGMPGASAEAGGAVTGQDTNTASAANTKKRD